MLSLLAVALLLADPPAAGDPKPAEPPPRVLNRVAALVNGEPLTLRDLQLRAGPEWLQIEAQPAGPERDRATTRVLRLALESLVAERLLQAQVKELGLEVTEAELDATIDDIKKRNRLDDAAFDRALSTEGLSREALRARLKGDLESMRVIQMKTQSRVKVGDEDLKNYYQQHERDFASGIEVHVRHVFLQVAAGATPAEEAKARERGEKALKRIAGGEDFAKVARELSQGPSAAEGGDLGWLQRGVVQAEVEKVAFALPTGQVSELVRTRTGFQILKVEGRRGGEPRTFDQVKEEIRDKLTYEQRDVLRQQYVTELKKDALIELRMAELKDP
jgi:peptidyl-prolyl cis-trans isomerase SurA